MNQGVYFGQIVIGPAGSGKVQTNLSDLVNILQTHAINGLNTPSQHNRVQPRPRRLVQRVHLRCGYKVTHHIVRCDGGNGTRTKWRSVLLHIIFTTKPNLAD